MIDPQKIPKNHKAGCSCFICKSIRGDFKGKNHPNYGKTFIVKESTKQKISSKLKNRIFSPEHKKALSLAAKNNTNGKGNRGKSFTAEHKLNISNSKKGSKMSARAIENISNGHKGLKRKPFSDNHKQKISLAHQGEKHRDWIDGRVFYLKQWRKNIKMRDNYTCLVCKKTANIVGANNIHAHHIKPKKGYPELKYDINNGITLCSSCHKKYEHKIVHPTTY